MVVVLVEQRRKRIIISSLSGDTFVVLIALWFFVLVEQRRKRIMISSMSSDAIFGPACLVVVLFTVSGWLSKDENVLYLKSVCLLFLSPQKRIEL